MTPPPVPSHVLDHGDLPREPTEESPPRPLAPPRRLAPTSRIARVLADLERHPGTSSRAMSYRVDMDQCVVSTTLSQLRAEGRVVRHGHRSVARWTIATPEST
jgi:hypothetical protein